MLKQTDKVVEASGCKSRNEFIIKAIESYIAELTLAVLCCGNCCRKFRRVCILPKFQKVFLLDKRENIIIFVSLIILGR
jgi:hypothetical protein